MTADDFTEAARAEAERRWSRDQTDGRPLSAYARMNRRIGFEIGALWAAAQEPTDAEVRAALVSWYGASSRTTIGDRSPLYIDMRAALSAARTARRDEEKR